MHEVAREVGDAALPCRTFGEQRIEAVHELVERVNDARVLLERLIHAAKPDRTAVGTRSLREQQQFVRDVSLDVFATGNRCPVSEMCTLSLVENCLVELRKALVEREPLRVGNRGIVVTCRRVHEGRVVPVPVDQIAVERVPDPVPSS